MKKENSTDFPSALKGWREKTKLSQRALSKKLGADGSLINHYEHGRTVPSPETAAKLIELGFPREFVRSGQHYHNYKKEKPTDEERLFAEENHKTVNRFLRFYRLNTDDWYDIVIFGYLRAVMQWFRREETHKYAFSTIAFGAMKGRVRNELKKRSTCPKTVSLDDIIPNTDFTYGDILCDPRDCVGI